MYEAPLVLGIASGDFCKMSSENLGRGELIEPFLLLGDGMNERSTMVGLAGDFHGSGLGAAHDFLVADRQHGDIGRYHFIRVAIIAAQGSLATPAVGLVGLQDFPIAAVADRARGYEIVLKQIAQTGLLQFKKLTCWC